MITIIISLVYMYVVTFSFYAFVIPNVFMVIQIKLIVVEYRQINCLGNTDSPLGSNADFSTFSLPTSIRSTMFCRVKLT